MKATLLRLAHMLWRFGIAGLVLCLLVVAGMQLILALLPLYQDSMTRLLSSRLNSTVEIGYLDARWEGGVPSLTLKHVSLTEKGEEHAGLFIDKVDVALNLRESLLAWTPVFDNLSVNGVTLEAEQSNTGEWSLAGIDAFGAERQTSLRKHPRLLKWLRYQGTIDIANISLSARHANGQQVTLSTPYFSLINSDGMKRLNARFELGKGTVEISGRGLGTAGGGVGWNGVISVRSLDLAAFCAMGMPCNDRLIKAPMTADTSWYYQEGEWQLNGYATIPAVAYKRASGEAGSLKTHTRFFMEGVEEEAWKLWINDFFLNIDQSAPYRGNWYVAGATKPEYTVTVASDSLNLAPIKTFLLDTNILGEAPKNLLKTLNPRGNINDLALRLYPARDVFDIDVSAQLQGVSVDAWEGAPLAENVSGQLRTRLLNGYFDLDSQQFGLGFPTIFSDTWRYSSAKARLYWTIDKDTYRLKSDAIHLTGEEGRLVGQLNLDIPLDNQRPLGMGLTVGVTDGNTAAKKYIPSRLDNLSEDLVVWLDRSIKQANIKQGGFIYNGVLEATEEPNDSSWGLFFDADEGSFNYHEDWPTVNQLSADVFVNKERVEVRAKKATTLNAALDNVLVKVPLDKDVTVSVAGHAVAKGNTLQRFLTETPINDLMAGEAKKWVMKGTFDTALQLNIPIQRPASSRVALQGHLSDFQLGFPEYGVTINALSGDLGFTTENGLSAKTLNGQLLGYPVTASVSSEMHNNAPGSTRVSWKSATDIPSLNQWLAMDGLRFLQGEASYSADLLIDHRNLAATVNVLSDLEGIEVALPTPLSKSRGKKQPFSLTYQVTKKQQDIALNLKGIGSAFVGLKPDKSLRYSTVLLGPDVRAGTVNPMKTSGNIVITGLLPELDVMPWYNWFKNQPASSKEQGFPGNIVITDVQIGQLRYEDKVVDDISIDLKPGSEALQLSVNSEMITGDLWIPDDDTKPYQLVLEHWVFSEESSDIKPQKKNLQLSPLTLPEADIAIQSLTAGSLKAIPVAFKLRKAPDGIKISDLNSTIAGMTLSGSIDWREENNQQHTYFYGAINGKTIQALQEELGLPSFIQAKDTELNGLLNWPGSPLDITFAETSGVVGVKMKDGKLKKLEGGAGALKLFGILNTESLRRRLMLDFSDLYASGLSFDHVEGTLRFNKGLVTFDRPIVIEGPSSNFKFDGLLDGNKETLDLSMVVTLPVSSNLPIFSFLLGASPPVAGIIFLADKLIGNEVDKLASMRYQIKGSFSNPAVELDRLFSSKTLKPGEESTSPKKQRPKAPKASFR